MRIKKIFWKYIYLIFKLWGFKIFKIVVGYKKSLNYDAKANKISAKYRLFSKRIFYYTDKNKIIENKEKF